MKHIPLDEIKDSLNAMVYEFPLGWSNLKIDQTHSIYNLTENDINSVSSHIESKGGTHLKINKCGTLNGDTLYSLWYRAN
jgi:hypothetical protein